MPPVSVFTPTWNQFPSLLDASVESSIMAGAAEVLVIDDGSDEPVENIWGDPVRVIRIEHGGVPAAYAAYLEHASRPWTARVPSDDECLPAKFTTLLNEAERLGAGAAYSWFEWQGGQGSEPLRFDVTDEQLPHRLKADNLFYGGATLIRTDLLKEIGPHPAHLHHAHDWHLHLEVALRTPWRCVPAVTTLRGWYPHGLSATRDSRQLNGERAWVRDKFRTLKLAPA